jgi:predicted PurR-regulated permease PerM
MALDVKARAKAIGESSKRRDEREALPLDPRARLTARVALALTITGLALWTTADFLPAIIWASILAIAVWPMHLRFATAISGRPSAVAAFLTTIIIGLLVFLPIGLATYQVAQRSDLLLAWIKQSGENGIQIPDWIAHFPIAAELISNWWRDNLANPNSAREWLQTFNADSAANVAKTFGGQLLHRAFMFFVSLVTLFVLLRGGYSIAQRIMVTADRIFGDRGESLAGKMTEAIRGTVNGTIVVAAAEGLLIGLAYVIAGVPNPALFTILTVAFAMLPFGAWAAFTAAALTLSVSGGSSGAGLALFGWGAVVMLAGDHFVWPTLVGGAARLPFLFAFVGIFGGLATFGLLGLFLGPVIMAALLTIWREWVIRRE